MKRFVKAPLKEYVFTINAALSPDEKASNPVIKNMSGEKIAPSDEIITAINTFKR